MSVTMIPAMTTDAPTYCKQTARYSKATGETLTAPNFEKERYACQVDASTLKSKGNEDEMRRMTEGGKRFQEIRYLLVTTAAAGSYFRSKNVARQSMAIYIDKEVL